MPETKIPPKTPSTTTEPKSLWELFTFFCLLAIQGFGGIVAFIENGLVNKKRWMTREQFLEDWAVARTLPGPPAINMGIIFGSRHFGAAGAITAVIGLFLVPSAIILLLAAGYTTFGTHPQIVDALKGMGAVAAGMIIATGIKLLTALRNNIMGHATCALIIATSFLAIIVVQIRVIHVMLVVGLIAWAIAYLRMSAAKAH